MANELVTYEEKWATAGRAFVERERATTASLSISGGVLKLGDDEIEGNQLCAIILDSVFINSYYDQKWEPGQTTLPPKCFAIAVDDEDLAPHPAMEGSSYFVPQHGQCAGCAFNEYGSADTGRGKACGNRRRLAIIPAGFYEKRKGSRSEFDVEIITDEAHYKTADMLQLTLPVTSGKEYAKYVKNAMSEFGRPPFGLVTRIYIEHGGQNQFTVKFETLDALPNEFFDIIMPRHEAARKEIMEPYQEPDAEALEKPRANNRLAGLRKNR